MVDWGALLGLMASAAEQQQDPFKVAVEVQQRLFTSKPILLGVEESLRHPDTPCGLKTDAERARHVRRRVREMRNSRGAWERYPSTQERTLKEIRCSPTVSPLWAPRPPRREEPPPKAGRQPARSLATTAKSTCSPRWLNPPPSRRWGSGSLCPAGDPGARQYGRTFTVADRLPGDRVLMAKWVRRMTNWHGR
jgi:hypothetical protein